MPAQCVSALQNVLVEALLFDSLDRAPLRFHAPEGQI